MSNNDNNNEEKYDCPARLLGFLYYNSYHYYPEAKACREFLVGMFKEMNTVLKGLDDRLYNLARRDWETTIQDALAIFHDVRYLLEKIEDYQSQVFDWDMYLDDMERHWTKWNAKMEERRASKEANQPANADEGSAK